MCVRKGKPEGHALALSNKTEVINSTHTSAPGDMCKDVHDTLENSRNCKTPRMPANGEMDELSYSHTREGYMAKETNFTHPGHHDIHKNGKEKSCKSIHAI